MSEVFSRSLHPRTSSCSMATVLALSSWLVIVRILHNDKNNLYQIMRHHYLKYPQFYGQEVEAFLDIKLTPLLIIASSWTLLAQILINHSPFLRKVISFYGRLILYFAQNLLWTIWSISVLHISYSAPTQSKAVFFWDFHYE